MISQSHCPFAHLSINRNQNQTLQPKQCERWTHRWTSPLTRTVWTLAVKKCMITTSSWVLMEWLQLSIMWKPVRTLCIHHHYDIKILITTVIIPVLVSIQYIFVNTCYFFNPSFCCPGVYLDGRCVLHKKPLLEGGTLGSQGHTLVVVPHLTESYGQDKSKPTNVFPLCTLKNFPHRIEHTLQVQYTSN